MKQALVKDRLTGDSKGGIYENLVADMLIKKNIPLRYYCILSDPILYSHEKLSRFT